MDIDKPEADFMHKCIYAVTSGIVRMGGERVDGVRAQGTSTFSAARRSKVDLHGIAEHNFRDLLLARLSNWHRLDRWVC